jgi:hypothetical protein
MKAVYESGDSPLFALRKAEKKKKMGRVQEDDDHKLLTGAKQHIYMPRCICSTPVI